MPTCAILSFRLGVTDGVSIVAGQWGRALERLGYTVVTVAGEGPVDRTVAGLALAAKEPPSIGEVEQALADADLVLVENLLTIPMNLAASLVVAEVLRGRPALLHHHDPPWQRAAWAWCTDLPPTDPSWAHVTINRLTHDQFAARGIATTLVYNGFGTNPHAADRVALRTALGVEETERLFVHPVRAIPRKNVPAAIALAEALDGTYWLLGPAEDGYGQELERLLAGARCRVLRGTVPGLAGFYPAADAVLFPSTWEGFGNPPLEAAVHRLPAAVGDYPVAAELRALGFRWFPSDDPAPLGQFLDRPDTALLDANERLVREHFSLAAMEARVRSILEREGWLP